jgi:hypothetical protein
MGMGARVGVDGDEVGVDGDEVGGWTALHVE